MYISSKIIISEYIINSKNIFKYHVASLTLLYKKLINFIENLSIIIYIL